MDFNAEGTEFAEKEGTPHPRVVFVRVANKRLMLDAASRASTFGELKAETHADVSAAGENENGS